MEEWWEKRIGGGTQTGFHPSTSRGGYREINGSPDWPQSITLNAVCQVMYLSVEWRRDE